MATVARVSAEINLKDNLSAPLKEAEGKVRNFADRSRDHLGRFTADASKKWAEFGDKLGEVGQRAQATGLVLSAAITAPIVLMAKKAVTAASDLNESFTKTQQVFGKSSDAVVSFSNKSAAALGLSKQAALDYASSFGLILQAGGKTEAESGKMSVTLSQLSADLASFYNVDVGTAADKLKSGLVGEAEPLRVFGVLLSENAVKARALAMGFKESGGQLSEAAKVQARYAIILDQTRKAQGDFNATADGLANTSRRVKAQLADLSAEFGAILLPLVQKGSALLLNLIERFKALSPEAKRNILVFAGVAAAIGPVLLVFGSMAGAIQNLISAKGILTAAVKALGSAFTASGGALGVLRAGLAALTGPVGIAIALATALFIAYQKNFAGVRDAFNALFADVKSFVAEIVGEVQKWIADNRQTIEVGWNFIKNQLAVVLKVVVNIIQIAWQIIKTVVGTALRAIMGLITAFSQVLQGNWSGAWEAIKATVLNVWRTQEAGIARIAAGILKIVQNLVQGVANQWDALMGMMGQESNTKVTFLDGSIKYLEDFADAADKAREKASGFKPANLDGLFGPIGGGKKGGGIEPLNPGAPGLAVAGAGGKEKKKKENSDLQELQRLTNQLAAAQMKLTDAKLRDIIATEDYGKVYDKIVDPIKKAVVAKKAEIQSFEEDQSLKKQYGETLKGLQTNLAKLNVSSDEEKALIDLRASELYAKLIPAQRKELETITLATIAREKHIATMDAEKEKRKALSESIMSALKDGQKNLDLLYATTEAQKMKWETEKGAYKDASGFAKALLIAQAAALDKAKAAKAAAEKWAEFWKAVIEKGKEFQEQQRKGSQDKYDEYIKRLTERMTELKGASEKLLRSQLAEQFKGLFPEVKNTEERAKKIQEKIDEIIKQSKLVAEAEKKFKFVQDLASKMEEVFMKAIDNMFENGFKDFFSNVVEGFRGMVRDIAAELIRLQIQKAIIWGINQIGGAGSAKGLFGGNASGGSVSPGTPRMVGETGPEIFVPNVPGRIVPNYNLGGGGGHTTNITVNVTTPNATSFRKSDTQVAAEVMARADRARRRDGRE